MHPYVLRIAYTRSGLRIVNRRTHTRHIHTSATPVSVSLPRACRFWRPCSLRAWYVNLTRSFTRQLPLRWRTFLRKQTQGPDIHGMRAGALCTCAGVKERPRWRSRCQRIICERFGPKSGSRLECVCGGGGVAPVLANFYVCVYIPNALTLVSRCAAYADT